MTASTSAAATRGVVSAQIPATGLRPGTFVLVLRPTDAAGNVGRDVLAKFFVLR